MTVDVTDTVVMVTDLCSTTTGGGTVKIGCLSSDRTMIESCWCEEISCPAVLSCSFDCSLSIDLD